MKGEYITTSEAAQRLGVHQSTVQRWVKQGHLAGEKLGPGRNSPYFVLAASVDQVASQLPEGEKAQT